MPRPDKRFTDLIDARRERRNVEYKEADARDPYVWTNADVRAKVARTAMAMANIGGGTIVIGMREVGVTWEPVGVSDAVAASFHQDRVQQDVNRFADPPVSLTVTHLEHDGKRFIVIEVAGFDELPVVCKASSGRWCQEGAVYTRARRKHESVAIQSQNE